MTARVREFNAFLRDFVNLNTTRATLLRSRVSAVNNFIGGYPEFDEVVAGDLIPQGSFAHKTLIRPYSGNDFDADVLVPMEEQDGWAPERYTVELLKAFKTSSKYRNMVELGKRCVKLDYSGDFHIDVVPFVTRADGQTYITHRTRNEFIKQDPVAYTAWFEEQNRTTNGHLVRVVRIVKYLRDRSSIQVPSIVLSALLAERVHSFAGVDEYSHVATTLTALLRDLDEYIGRMVTPPWVDDKTGQNLADRLTQSGFENLQSQLKGWARSAQDALAADADESVEKWKKLLGDGFGVTAADESSTTASVLARSGPFEKQVVPGEQDLSVDYGIPIQLDPYQGVRVVGRVAPNIKGIGRFRPLSATGNHVPPGRSLKFSIERCTVEEPYDVYWKVRNAGEEAARRSNFRGEINRAGRQITESSSFQGEHWVQAWIVKDGVAVATDVQDVTILST